VLKTYRSLVSIPHARGFVLAGFVARLSISMRALGAVLMVSTLTGSYGLAGAIAAAALLGEALAAPRLGRLVDRYGQQRVLLLSLAVHSVGTLARCREHWGTSPWRSSTPSLERGGSRRTTSPSLRHDAPHP
jgi:hypothetical protein